MPLAEVYRVAQRFHRELLQAEKAASMRLLNAYGEAWRRIEQMLRHWLEEERRLAEQGAMPGPGMLYRRQRLEAFRQQVLVQMRGLAQVAGVEITGAQRQAIMQATEHAYGLIYEALGPGVLTTWVRLPAEAMETMVGFLGDGSPLSDLLNEIGEEAAKRMARELQIGVALGQNPRQVARRVRQANGLGMTRALRICRTEMLRAYREATRANYQANSDIIAGWIWHAHLGPRTCMACWMMHGTVHPLDEPLFDHPNGRCTMLPLLKPLPELGGVSLMPGITPGKEAFLSLPAERQMAIMGADYYHAWKKGLVSLDDMVEVRESRRWGRSIGVPSLRRLLSKGDYERVRAEAREGVEHAV
ncbi:MAG TPA: phage minor head protein [Armatimonadota bacterium]|nr:phage minor head protein [Armatimonadota bacterium]